MKKITFEQFKEINKEGNWGFTGRYEGEYTNETVFYIRVEAVDHEITFSMMEVKMYANWFKNECENQIHFKKGLADTRKDESSIDSDIKEMKDLLHATTNRKSRSKARIIENGQRYKRAIIFKNKHLKTLEVEN